MVSRSGSAARLLAACRERLPCDMHMREQAGALVRRFMLRRFMQCHSI